METYTFPFPHRSWRVLWVEVSSCPSPGGSFDSPNPQVEGTYTPYPTRIPLLLFTLGSNLSPDTAQPPTGPYFPLPLDNWEKRCVRCPGGVRGIGKVPHLRLPPCLSSPHIPTLRHSTHPFPAPVPIEACNPHPLPPLLATPRWEAPSCSSVAGVTSLGAGARR